MSLKLKLFFLLILAANILIIFYYQYFTYRAFFNSDAAITNILAQEMISQKSYYPNTWWYVNGDIWTFYKHTLAAIFILAGFSAYTVHTAVVLVFFIFSLFLTYKYLKKIAIDTKGILVALVGISTLYSPMYAREVLGESAYIWYYSAIILYLYSFYVLTYESYDKRKAFFATLLILFLSIMFVAENPSRFAIYFMAPLFSPLFLLYPSIELKYKKIALYFMIGLVLGIIYRYFISTHIQMQAGVEKAFIIPFEELPVHIWRSFGGLINFYGALWEDKTHFPSFLGVIFIFKLLLLPIAFFAPIFYTVKNKNALNFFQIYTIVLGYIAFFIIFGIYSFTSLHINGLYAAKENIRYIIPFVLIISIANGIAWKFYSQRIKILLLFSVILSYLSIFHTLHQEEANKIIKDREEVIQALIKNNATKGYAPYWHSHIFTVLSDNKVEVRPLEDQNYEREAGTWLSSSTWYDKNYTDKNSFILMPKDKIEPFEKATSEQNLTKASKTLELDSYKIYIFDQNPIKK